jgi:two-component system sensor histidine kinase/response regulator
MEEQRPVRILIVDDEDALMKALTNTLKDQGYYTAGFTKGQAALAALREQPFEVLLSDLMMPEMDGISMLRAALEIDPNLVGIIMTGAGTISTAVEAMKSGAFDYILKPFKMNAILPVLSRAVALRDLRVKNAMLERKVRERTAELEVANAELEAFSYSVSHDLQAPLRHINGFVEILMQQHAPEMRAEARRMLEVVSGEAHQMDQLIHDLLRFAHLGRQPLIKQLIQPAELFMDILDELKAAHAGREVEIRLSELPDCQADSALLRQVLVNLLSNAFKFTRQRENAIVEIGGRIEGFERIYFVRDNGAGFDMQYAEKLFGAFKRLHSADQFEGTGVGLSIVQRIVVRHGGRVWAEAAVDKGATFYFSLPD